MKILIAGGSGFIGKALISMLKEASHEVVLISRRPESQKEQAISWEHESLTKAIPQFEAIVNLAGVNLFERRWNAEFKKEIVESRVNSVRSLAAALKDSGHCPEVLVQGTAIGYYGSHNSTDDYNEETAVGDDFLAESCAAWESATDELKERVQRLVIVRTGVVLGHGSGALEEMLKPFKMFLGGPMGSGRQWVSWIHLKDCARLFYEGIVNENYEGVYNGTAPNPVTNKEQCRSLAKHLGRPCWLRVPSFAIRLMLGEVADLVVNGQRVLPKRAVDENFDFEFPDIDSAFKDLLH